MKSNKKYSRTIGFTIITIIVFSTIYFYYNENHFVDFKKNDYSKAISFIKKRLTKHKAIYKKLVDADGEFVYYSPYDYDNLYKAKEVLDSLLATNSLVTIEEEDQWKISNELLKKHVDNSIYTWKTSKFSRDINFEDFSNYLLPYRIEHELSSNYQEIILDTFSEVFDSIQLLKTRKQAVIAINDEFKKRIVFDLRSHADLNSPSVLETLAQKKGSCKSITQFTALSMRAMGLTVAIDECPIWAHRNSGHQWNAFLNKDLKWIPFGGAETNPDEFYTINDSVKAPKIFRHTFSFQNDFAPPLINKVNIPPIFQQENRIDVTHEYVSTSNVEVKLNTTTENNKILYLAVFNAEQWKIVSWSIIKNGVAIFKQMGDNNIIYLPVFYKKGEIISADDPFLLTPSEKIILTTNFTKKEQIFLKYYNKLYDIEWHIGKPNIGSKMELFYWNNNWVSCGVQVVEKDRTLKFIAPKNALFLIKSYDFENTWQRIFTLENGEQVWF